jgi:hypothetical protein
MPDDYRIEIASLLASRTKTGAVEIAVLREGQIREKIQMDLPKAREILAMLSGAIEAAISDELMFRFLVEHVGLDEPRAAAALLQFRELRQGSRGAVYPH